MFFEFMQYAFVWHSSQFYAMLAVGVISGLIFARKRKKKSGMILLNIIIWVMLIYPLMCSTNYMRYHAGVQACNTHQEYVMIRGICYAPIDGYVPYYTQQINKEVGDAVKDTSKK